MFQRTELRPYVDNYIIRIQIAEDVNVNTNILDERELGLEAVLDGTGTPLCLDKRPVTVCIELLNTTRKYFQRTLGQ